MSYIIRIYILIMTNDQERSPILKADTYFLVEESFFTLSCQRLFKMTHSVPGVRVKVTSIFTWYAKHIFPLSKENHIEIHFHVITKGYFSSKSLITCML